ncbi:MAG: hypothetical protein ACTHMX_11645, partial [Thermomicrobiales bacterium]
MAKHWKRDTPLSGTWGRLARDRVRRSVEWERSHGNAHRVLAGIPDVNVKTGHSLARGENGTHGQLARGVGPGRWEWVMAWVLLAIA